MTTEFKKRYSYTVAEWDTDEILGEGSGPASHVAANLRRLADVIDPPETIKPPETIIVAPPYGKGAFA